MSGETSWELSEFDTHKRRLDEVATKVSAAAESAHQAQDSNGAAFGLLFGWMVTPVLNMVCDDASQFADDLVTAMEASVDGIDQTKKTYEQSEQDRAAAVRDVEQMLAEKQRGI